MTEEAKRKQRKRRQICLKFTDNPADWLIYQHIKKQQNIAAYIRRLVRRDMECEAARKAFDEGGYDEWQEGSKR